MLNVEIDEQNGIAIFSPDDKLSETDFRNAAALIDPYIEKKGRLNGLIICIKSFPGWRSFSALLAHLSFIKNHHKKIKCIAFVTDAPIAGLAEHAGRHFVSAQIKAFGYDQLELATVWITGSHDG